MRSFVALLALVPGLTAVVAPVAASGQSPVSGQSAVPGQDLAPGQVVAFAGDGESGFKGDNGPALKGRFGTRFGLAADARGNVYIADRENDRIRRIDPHGRLSTVMKTDSLRAVDVDKRGALYIAEGQGIRVREPGGSVRTLVGGGTSEPAEGRRATDVRFYDPPDVAIGPAGNVYLCEAISGSIWRVDRKGVLHRAAGPAIPTSEIQSLDVDAKGTIYYTARDTRSRVFSTDKNGKSRRLGDGDVVAVGSDDRVYVSSQASGVRRIGPDGAHQPIAMIGYVSDLAVGRHGDIFGGLDRIFRIGGAGRKPAHPPKWAEPRATGRDPYAGRRPGSVATVASARLFAQAILELRFDLRGDLAVADPLQRTVRRLRPGGDRELTAAPDFGPGRTGIGAFAYRPNGDIYTIEQGGLHLRRPGSEPIRVAGTGSDFWPSEDKKLRIIPDAPTATAFPQMLSVTTGTDGSAYFSTEQGIYQLDPSGTLHTVGKTGEGEGTVDRPLLRSDPKGRVYIVWRNRIERISASGVRSTVARTADSVTSYPDHPEKEPNLGTPQSLAASADGNLYFVESSAKRLRVLVRPGAIPAPPAPSDATSGIPLRVAVPIIVGAAPVVAGLVVLIVVKRRRR